MGPGTDAPTGEHPEAGGSDFEDAGDGVSGERPGSEGARRVHGPRGAPPLRRLPKIELHLHLEGCLTPFEARYLAAKNRKNLPGGAIESLYRHDGFGSFLANFGRLLDLFAEPRDLVWLLRRVRDRLRRQGVVYAEIRVSPSVWERHSIPPAETLGMLCREASGGTPPVRFIVDGVRQWDEALLERDLALALSHRHLGVVAFGLGGDEVSAPAARFGDLASFCRAERLPVVPHAGEALGPEEVLSALGVFDPARIGHGIAAASSPGVMDALVRAGVHLEVCPTSNRATGVVPRGTPHPMGTLWRSGVSLSLGSDDPGLFGTTLGRELGWALKHGGWTLEDVGRSMAMAARAAFLRPGERDGLLAALGV